jgi:putative transposase
MSEDGSLRRDVLSAYVFRTLEEVRLRTTEWMYDHNHLRPHKALGNRPPVPIQP